VYKIIILIEPVEGHFNPFVPIINKFVEQGYQVVCMTGSNFKERVEKTGATFHNIPTKWDPEDKDIIDIFPELNKRSGLSQIKYYLKHILFDQVPEVLNALKKILDNFSADAVICDSFMIAGGWMTELGGPPNVRLSVLPLGLPGKNIPPNGLGMLPGKSLFSKLRIRLLNIFFERIVFNDVKKHANKIRQQLKLTPYKKSIFKYAFEIPDLILHTSIPSFEYPRKEYPANFQFIGPIMITPHDDYEKPKWWPELENGSPVVLVNQGTIAKDHTNLIQPAIEGLKNEKINLIAVPVKKGEIQDTPENVHTEPYIPFGNLLPHVDVMITNGGFGGTQNALAHGIPIIIAGATEDKMEVAARVEYSGAGINLKKQQPTPGDIKNAVRKILLDSSYRKKAEELRTLYAQYDAPTLAVGFVRDLITKHTNITLHN
jgi:MGT family glycosyltransferase